MMFRTIADLRHFVRTAYGDSDIWFGGSGWLLPPQGVGQGNGGGPAIWAFVSTPLFDKLRAEGHGAAFESAITRKVDAFVGYGFVDDVDLITVGPSTWQETAAKMQQAGTSWESALRATGGALEVEGEDATIKSHWFLISFEWTGRHWRYCDSDSTPAELVLRDYKGEIKTLKRYEVSHAERTLGVRLAPDGKNKSELKH
jgi:hypothetical protein